MSGPKWDILFSNSTNIHMYFLTIMATLDMELEKLVLEIGEATWRLSIATWRIFVFYMPNSLEWHLYWLFYYVLHLCLYHLRFCTFNLSKSNQTNNINKGVRVHYIKRLTWHSFKHFISYTRFIEVYILKIEFLCCVWLFAIAESIKS